MEYPGLMRVEAYEALIAQLKGLHPEDLVNVIAMALDGRKDVQSNLDEPVNGPTESVPQVYKFQLPEVQGNVSGEFSDIYLARDFVVTIHDESGLTPRTRPVSSGPVAKATHPLSGEKVTTKA